MKKLTTNIMMLLLLAGLAACQTVSTPIPTIPATIIPTDIPITNTPPPPPATIAPTAEHIPALNSPNGPPLSLIKMFTAKDGWGLISNALLVTHNGGVNWYSVPLPEGEVDQNSVVFFSDMNNLYLVVPASNGQGGLLHRTTNGGGTWETYPVPFSRGQLTIMFNVGYFMETASSAAESQSVVFYLSTDFGATWQKVSPTGASTIQDAGLKTGFSLLNVTTAWLGMAKQDQKILIYRTDNKGSDWTAQPIPAPENISDLLTSTQPPLFFAGDEKSGILPVDFIPKDDSETSRVFYLSSDGGLTWQPGGSVIEGAAYTFIDPKNGWVWGKGGIYFTSDGGQTWQLRPVAFGRSEHATCLSFVDVNTGFMLTTDAKNRVRIYSTIDSGNTWISVNP